MKKNIKKLILISFAFCFLFVVVGFVEGYFFTAKEYKIISDENNINLNTYLPTKIKKTYSSTDTDIYINSKKNNITEYYN